jgi:hypothetical protein
VRHAAYRNAFRNTPRPAPGTQPETGGNPGIPGIKAGNDGDSSDEELWFDIESPGFIANPRKPAGAGDVSAGIRLQRWVSQVDLTKLGKNQPTFYFIFYLFFRRGFFRLFFADIPAFLIRFFDGFDQTWKPCASLSSSASYRDNFSKNNNSA